MRPFEFKSFEEVSKVVTKMFHRMGKHVIGMFTPSAVFMSSEVDQEAKVVGKMIIPMSGTITNVCIHVPGVSKKSPAEVLLELNSGGLTTTLHIVLNKEVLKAPQTLDVKEGDILTLFVISSERAEVLASLVFVPGKGQYKFERYLLDQIEEANEGIRDTFD